jgi:hypothetical protein
MIYNYIPGPARTATRWGQIGPSLRFLLIFAARAQCTGSARSGAHRGGRRRPERLKLTGKHRMSMLYRPLVGLTASRRRPEPPEAPQWPMRGSCRSAHRTPAGGRLGSLSRRSAPPPTPPALPARLARVVLAMAAGHASGSSTCDRRSDRAVSQECKSQWETSGGGGSSWNGSPDCRRRRARSGRASTLMGCGLSPPRRSPADDATSPASRSISSSSARRLIHKPSDQEVEFALRS